MPRTPARTTQADVARCIRAAQKAGAHYVEVRPDGSIAIFLVASVKESAPSGLDQNEAVEL